MKDWVGALSTIPREHPGVNNLVLAYICSLYICILIYRLSAVRCVVRFMKDWVGALSTIPREHPGVNNLVLAYTCSLYICIFIYRLSAVRCTIMLVWAGLLSTNYMLCLPPFHELHALRSVRFDDISTSHLPPPTSHPTHLPPPTALNCKVAVGNIYDRESNPGL